MNPFRWSFRAQFLSGFVACAALLAYAFYVQFELQIQPRRLTSIAPARRP